MTTTLPLGPDELLTTTRSVRKRLDLDRPVPIGLVREALEVALQAPTGGNSQGWHWMVVTDPELRAAIGELLPAVVRATTATSARYPGRAAGDDPAAAGGAERQAVQARVAGSADHLAEVMGRVPVHVIACITAGEELPAGNQAGLWGSLLPAAWSYQLAARARGLGSAWTTLHLRYEKEIAELLEDPAVRPAGRAAAHRVLHRRDVPARRARTAGHRPAPGPLVAGPGSVGRPQTGRRRKMPRGRWRSTLMTHPQRRRRPHQLAAVADRVDHHGGDGVGRGGQRRRLAPLGHPGVHEPGPHDRHADAGRAQGLGEAGVERVQAGLGGAVDEVRPAGPLAGDRGERDERAVALLAQPLGQRDARPTPPPCS